MAFEMTVMAFNDGYEISNLVTGILHFFNSSEWTAILAVAMGMGLLLSWVKFGFIFRNNPTYGLVTLFAPLFLWAMLLLPTMRLNIQDQYTGEIFTLSKVPVGLGIPLAVSSQFEYALTDVIDKRVRPATSPAFQQFDFMGHARMLSHISNPQIYNEPHIINTIADYGQNCLIPALASGELSMQALRTSPNILSRVNLGYQVYFTQIHSPSGAATVTTCANAYNEISTLLSAAINLNMATPFRRKVLSWFGNKANNPTAAITSLNVGTQAMFKGFQNSGDQLFKQLYMINGLKSTLSAVEPTLGMAIAEAEQKQFTTQTIGGLITVKQAANYRSVLKLFLIALTPILAPFWLLSTGRSFLYWFGAFIWVSLFLPMEAVVHAVTTARSLDELQAFTNLGGFSLQNMPSVMRWATETNAQAATLMLGIYTFAALIMTWAFPRGGMSVMSMLQANQMAARHQVAASMGGTVAAEQRVMGLEGRQAAGIMLGKGAYISGVTREMNSQFSAFENNYMNTLFGEEKPFLHSGGAALKLAMGGGEMTLRTQVSADSMQSINSQISQSHAMLNSAITDASKVNTFSLSGSEARTLTDGITASRGQGYTVAESQAIDNAYSKVVKHLESQGVTQEFLKTSEAKIHAGLSLGFGPMSLSGGGSKEWKKGEGESRETADSTDASLQERVTASANRVISDYEDFFVQNGSQHSESWNASQQEAASTTFRTMASATRQLSELQTLQGSLIAGSSASLSEGLDMYNFASRMGLGGFLNARAFLPETNQEFEKQGQRGNNLEAVFLKEVSGMFKRGDWDSLIRVGKALDNAGVDNADNFLSIVTHQKYIAGKVTGK